jgi:hypothetical protein
MCLPVSSVKINVRASLARFTFFCPATRNVFNLSTQTMGCTVDSERLIPRPDPVCVRFRFELRGSAIFLLAAAVRTLRAGIIRKDPQGEKRDDLLARLELIIEQSAVNRALNATTAAASVQGR